MAADSHFLSGESWGTNLPRGPTCLQAKNIIVGLSLWVRLRIKKNVGTQWQIILYFSNLLGCAGAGRCTRLCQVPHCNICEHADQLLFASVCRRRHTSGKQNLYQKPFPCFTVQGSQFQLEDWGGRLHFSKQTFYLRILAFTSSVLVPFNQYISFYFAGRSKCWLKSHVNLLVHLAPWFLKGLALQNLTFC